MQATPRAESVLHQPDGFLRAPFTAAVDRGEAALVGEISAVRSSPISASPRAAQRPSVHNQRGFVRNSPSEVDQARRDNRRRLWSAHRAQAAISRSLYGLGDPRAELLKRFALCRRFVRGDQFSLKQRGRRCHLGDVVICGSPWCVGCGVKIAEVRALEYAAAALVVIEAGGLVGASSWTFSHSIGDPLDELLALLAAAMKAVDRDKSVKEIRQAILWHHVRRLDDTWGPINGHHAHRHAVPFYRPGTRPEQAVELDRIEFGVFQRFFERRGREASFEKGHRFDVLDTATAAEQVITYLCKDAMRELTYSATKWGRGENRSMAQILADFHARGEARDRDAWLEYAIAMRGKKAIRPSPGLRRELLPQAPDLTDEQVAELDDGLGLVLDTFPQPILDALWRSRLGPAALIDAGESAIADGDYDQAYLYRRLEAITARGHHAHRFEAAIPKPPRTEPDCPF